MLRRFWSAETGVFLAVWLVLLLVGRSTLLRDPGTFWHTAVGQQMLQTGQLVRADTFSFTRQGETWVPHQWLSECGMAAIYRLGGWDALLLVAATILAGSYTWIAGRMLRARFHLLSVGVVLAVVLLASSHQFHVRPLVVSIALLGVTYSLLVDVEAGRRGLRKLWWLVPLTALWANLHAGVLAGIGTVGLVAVGWCAAWALGRDSPVRCGRDVVALAALLVLLCLAVLVNPYGIGLPRAWFATLAIPLPGLIQEHRPVDPADPLGWALLVLGLGYLAAVIGVFGKRIRISWLLPLVLLVLACQRVRNVPLFAITAAIALAEMIPQSRWAKWLEDRELLLPPQPGQSNGPSGPSRLSAALPLALVAVAVVLQAGGVSAPVIGSDWARFDAAHWPVELLPKLQEINRNSPPDDPISIFNDMNFGGFLIFHAPRLRVFIDDRCALYGSELLKTYDRARRENPRRLDDWQAEYGFRYALVETGKHFDAHLQRSDAWMMLQRTPVATLYQRKDDDK